MEQELKRHYSLLVEFLGHILGPDYEIALHELKDDSNQIIAIANGELTGRHLGSPLSNKMLEYLTSRLYETAERRPRGAGLSHVHRGRDGEHRLLRRGELPRGGRPPDTG